MRETFTVDEVAKRLGVVPDTIYRAAKRGDIPTIRVGRKVLIPRVAFERLLEGNAKTA